MPITNLTVPYPDFQINTIMDPDAFDANNAATVNKVNEIIAEVNDNIPIESNVLTLDQTDPFTPDADYEPSTKKYADDLDTAQGVLVQANNDAIVVINANKPNTVDVVLDTGNQTVAGIKTFNSSPIIPAPTSDLQASTKKYVDDKDALDVKLSGNQTIAGIKTFSSSPIIPTPTTSTQATTKAYVDGADSNLQGQITTNDSDITALQGAKADITYVDSADDALSDRIISNDNDITSLQNTKSDITYEIGRAHV